MAKKVRGRRAEAAAVRERVIGEEPAEQSHDVSDTEEPDNSSIKPAFYGLVDTLEIDYFKQAESTLNINAFDSDEDRAGFIRSVLEEARGKELKLVTNQICSKLMERLILHASDIQLKQLFLAFATHFVALSHHKYSSHVVETLIVRGAALIEKELIEGLIEDDEITTSMEDLFLSMVNEYKPHVQAMVDHQYSSHVLRLLILVLSGKELPSSTMANSTLRSKKSKIARKMIDIKDNTDFNRLFQTTASFKGELRDVLAALVSGVDVQRMRELAIHKVASPVIQLAIQVEGIVDRDRKVWHLVFLGEDAAKEGKEEAFVEHLLSDSVGSHFLETIIKNDGARIKYLDRLYQLYMKGRVLKLAKRSTTGVYIIQALMFKLKPVEVEHILDCIIPELSSLISIADNQNLDLGKSVIDASISRGNYRRTEVIDQLFAKFAPNFDRNSPVSASTELLENVLQLSSSTLGNTKDDWPTAEERRRALFLEKLMEYDGEFVICVWLNFLALPIERFVQMCFHGVFSHVVENALVVQNPEPKNITILRKRFLNIFPGNIVSLSLNSYGSHIVDKLWTFTVTLPMYKDRIATELVGESKKVKDSIYGRLVWKNWSLDLFLRKKFDWKALVKEQEQQHYGGAEHKTAIQLKLEQLHKEKTEQAEKEERKRAANQPLEKKQKRGRRK